MHGEEILGETEKNPCSENFKPLALSDGAQTALPFQSCCLKYNSEVLPHPTNSHSPQTTTATY